MCKCAWIDHKIQNVNEINTHEKREEVEKNSCCKQYIDDFGQNQSKTH